nr:ribonuclease H-like domain-containing protein [Tanacetum cinerariifolium]
MANDEANHALIPDEETPIEFALMAKTSDESERQRLDKNKEELGYSDVPPPPAQIYSPPKKDMSWTSLPEFADDTVTDYSRPAPTVESSPDDAQNRNPSVTVTEASPSTISPKPFIKFIKANDSPTKSKTDKVATAKKPPVKPVVHKPYRPPIRPMRSNMNAAWPNKTYFNKPTHSYRKRPFQRTSAVRSQYRGLRVPPVSRKFPLSIENFPLLTENFPLVAQNFPLLAPKALMAIDEVGWDWSYMENDEEDHALVADEVAPTEFALMANTSAESKVFDNSLCSKDCKKNNDSLNSKITYLTDKLFDAKNMIYHYKLGLAQVEYRLVEYKEREVKYYEKIRTLEFRTESNNECIEILKKKLETLKQEKERVDGKLAGLLTASKDLDNLIESQRADKNKEGLGYSVVPPSPAQIYSSPKKDLNPSVSETVASPITPKPFIKFVKPKDSQSKNKIDETKTPKKPPVKNFPTANRKFPTASRKFPAGSTKCSTADMGIKGKAVKPSACWFWKPSQNLYNKGSSQNNINEKGYWDSGCSRHMTGNISYLSDYEPFDEGYVSFGQGGCKITEKGTIKTECIVLGRDFKLLDDANILLRTPRQHNMYSINLNNIVPHRDLTCLVAKASADECMLWHKRL